MAIRASREVVIDAPPEAIMDALADIKALPSWSSVHKRAEVIDTYADGRPHHVKVTAKLMGIVDTEVLEYHWGPNWLVWDAEPTDRQHGQHVEYTLGTRRRRDARALRHHAGAQRTAARIADQAGRKIVLDDATEGLASVSSASRLA